MYLENMLQRALQRAICMLHHVELPMRAMFKANDGGTTGTVLFLFYSMGAHVQNCLFLYLILNTGLVV